MTQWIRIAGLEHAGNLQPALVRREKVWNFVKTRSFPSVPLSPEPFFFLYTKFFPSVRIPTNAHRHMHVMPKNNIHSFASPWLVVDWIWCYVEFMLCCRGWNLYGLEHFGTVLYAHISFVPYYVHIFYSGIFDLLLMIFKFWHRLEPFVVLRKSREFSWHNYYLATKFSCKIPF